MAVGGVILFAYEDGFDVVSNVLGVVLSVGSAVGAAFYKVMHGFARSVVCILNICFSLSCLFMSACPVNLACDVNKDEYPSFLCFKV